jgi:hypothetical protein
MLTAKELAALSIEHNLNITGNKEYINICDQIYSAANRGEYMVTVSNIPKDIAYYLRHRGYIVSSSLDSIHWHHV